MPGSAPPPGLSLEVPLLLGVLALGVLGANVLVLDAALGLYLVLLLAPVLSLEVPLLLAVLAVSPPVADQLQAGRHPLVANQLHRLLVGVEPMVLHLVPGFSLEVPLHLDVLALGVLGADVLVLGAAVGLGLVLLAAAALVLDDALILDAVLGLGLVLLLLAVLDAGVADALILVPGLGLVLLDAVVLFLDAALGLSLVLLLAVSPPVAVQLRRLLLGVDPMALYLGVFLALVICVTALHLVHLVQLG